MSTPVPTRRGLADTPIVRPSRAAPTPGYVRRWERRLRDAPFFLVERRKGKRWMYGSIALAAALWTYIYLFVQLRF